MYFTIAAAVLVGGVTLNIVLSYPNQLFQKAVTLDTSLLAIIYLKYSFYSLCTQNYIQHQ
jgi:hypothetical protein